MLTVIVFVLLSCPFLSSFEPPMPPRLSAFPKCYLDRIAGARTMTVFEWIMMARSLDCDGLEMYEGFFTSLEPGYLDSVADALADSGFAMPMLCCSPDFTNPDPDARKLAVEKEVAMVRATLRLGGPRAVCRVLSGQRYPDVSREQGLEWVVECINQVLPVAKECDIVLGLENHYKDGSYCTPKCVRSGIAATRSRNTSCFCANSGYFQNPSL